MLTNGIESFNVDNLQFNLVGSNFGNLDFTQATNALKLETSQPFAQTAMDGANQAADSLGSFDDFLAEARSSRDAAAGIETPTLPTNSSSPSSSSSASSPSSGVDSSPPADAPETTWSVDRATNTINLDNGYRVKLNEANSEMLLEKLNEAGELEKSTKIWGDPHLDAGNDGVNDADFWKDSTLALEDGTKITIGTREQEGTDMTFADLLTITKGDQAVEVSGLMNGADALNIGDVNTNGVELDAATNDGHVLVEGQGNDWHLQDGRTIGQDTEYLEFAQNEIDNEVRMGDAWIPDAATVTGRGGNGAGIPDEILAAGGLGGAGAAGAAGAGAAGGAGGISEALRAFLEMQGIEFEDEGDDGILSVDEWDSLIAAMEDSRGGMAGGAQGMLQMLLKMKEQIAQMLENLSLQNTEVA